MIDIMAATLLASAYPMESGQMHSKQSGRYEVVKTLPKQTDSVAAMLTYAKAKGQLRMAYIHNSYAERHTSAFAVGGIFGFETASYRDISLHVNATTSQRIAWLNPNNSQGRLAPDFFDASGDAFAYVSHANIEYDNGYINLKAGRMSLNTPYLDTDDIRMAANSFEGLFGSYRPHEQIVFSALYVTRWAGYDSGDVQHRFTPLTAQGSGVTALGMQYIPDDEHSASLWYYHADAMSHIFYAEYSGHYNIAEDFHIEYGVQAALLRQIEHSGSEGAVLGVMGIVDYGPVFCGVALNRGFVDTNSILSDGFGGGPYYTSLDEATLGSVSEAALGDDVMAYRLGVGYEFESVGLTVEGVVGQLRSRHQVVNIKESDLIVTYRMNSHFSLQGSLMAYHSHDEHDNFNRGIVRMDYSF